MGDLGALEAVLSRTKLRLRAGRAIASMGYALTAGAAVAAIDAVVRRALGQPSSWPLELGLIAGTLFAATVVSVSLPVRDEDAAARLDAAHDLHDRVRSAVEFARAARGVRTRFMDAALRDASGRAPTLSPRLAVPFTTPRALAWLVLPLCAWLAAGLLPEARAPRAKAPPPSRAVALDRDELAAFRDDLRRLEQSLALTPEAAADVRAYNALLERVAVGELERSEAIEALIAFERRLMKQTETAGAVDSAALHELAKDLARADETLAKALGSDDARAASKALDDLAARLDRDTLSEAQRRALSDALHAARKREELATERKARAEELERLLRDKTQRTPGDPSERSLFERSKRELERLRRDLESQAQRHRELARLSRDLSDASAAMAEHEDHGASESMRRGAEDLSRFGEDQLSREQREKLAKQVRQLREALQRNATGNAPRARAPESGQSRDARTRRFVLRAEGHAPDEQTTKLMMRREGRDGEQDGAEAAGQRGSSAQGEPGDQARGASRSPGDRQASNGTEQEGEKSPAGRATVLELAGDEAANAEVELPAAIRDGATVRSDGAGREHDPRMLRAPTDLDAAHEDSRVAASAGKGPARSQVILDAADRGFATSAYRRVYTEYRAHAEEVLEHDDIPPGYEFYVRRYFQLIRPRDSRETP